MITVSAYCGTTKGTRSETPAARANLIFQSIVQDTYSSLPSRPPGRTASTMSISRYMKASARSWK
jgi:hypothetical protein